ESRRAPGGSTRRLAAPRARCRRNRATYRSCPRRGRGSGPTRALRPRAAAHAGAGSDAPFEALFGPPSASPPCRLGLKLHRATARPVRAEASFSCSNVCARKAGRRDRRPSSTEGAMANTIQSTAPARLEPDALYRRCDPAALSFSSTDEVDDLAIAVGQDRAL